MLPARCIIPACAKREVNQADGIGVGGKEAKGADGTRVRQLVDRGPRCSRSSGHRSPRACGDAVVWCQSESARPALHSTGPESEVLLDMFLVREGDSSREADRRREPATIRRIGRRGGWTRPAQQGLTTHPVAKTRKTSSSVVSPADGLLHAVLQQGRHPGGLGGLAQFRRGGGARNQFVQSLVHDEQFEEGEPSAIAIAVAGRAAAAAGEGGAREIEGRSPLRGGARVRARGGTAPGTRGRCGGPGAAPARRRERRRRGKAPGPFRGAG